MSLIQDAAPHDYETENAIRFGHLPDEEVEVETTADVPPFDDWQPIASVSHEDSTQVWLRAPGARDAVWEWSERSNRWERADGLYWPEGDEFGPEEWRSVR